MGQKNTASASAKALALPFDMVEAARQTASTTGGSMDEKRDDLKKEGFKDSLEGKADQLKGHIKDAAGGLSGDKDLQIKGKIDEMKGKVKDALGRAERKVEESRNKVDDSSNRFADSDPDRSRDDDL